MNKRLIAVGLASLLGMSGSLALAKVSPEQAARLGSDELTPMGAERAGNADGTIPRWEGGYQDLPAGYTEGERLVDPFSADEPLFTITAENVEQYADKLSPGQVAMFRRYPDTYQMPVYPTRRSARLPESEYDLIKEWATKTDLVAGGNGLVDFKANVPFPIPETGIEVIWNHITRYRTPLGVKRRYIQAPVQANGAFAPVLFEEEAIFANRFPDNPNPNRLFVFLQRILAPARLEGDVLLVHENVDQVKEPRSAWVYNAGQRRVRRAPNIAYDGPGVASDGLRTADDLDLFNGAPDRYNWELVGKRELYIPYNAYALRRGDLAYTDIIKPGHMDPQYLRYELHRVWVVEATLKDDARHIYARRTFYVDEDTWQIAVVDHYDGRGELWKMKEGHMVMHYQVAVPWLAAESLHDLISGRYVVIGLDNEERGYQYDFDYVGDFEDFTPAALRRAGRR
ncbi:DUF1329 domain-containing protein [Haliea sp.]|jgi:hypothetical protein|uniref:DUF1329 domain-containing protein n=1 Tax=Haliea salexigens TaxID=287487 RepID=A0A3C1KIN4_9GAMM|nr:DUF1329 domain-containing protein [Haliea sp.]MAY94039.1 outer membrane lipoprotein-sorting protein [Haliea sp.]MBK40724.1 outer membrane lipoprotein-sorting protein [Haliea sp.]MBP69411.1 outer membrane lipoprotein-sorting protein [Haliea sp.]HAN26547.1 DUF1329 domain-containing protein [Haliea salexigens]|tara:strand:- start:381 stop:1745 length:1365 start_codon:yes stop_codon:yes gene_type:complete